MASVSPPIDGIRGQNLGLRRLLRNGCPGRQVRDRQPGHLRHDLAEGPPVGVVCRDRAASGSRRERDAQDRKPPLKGSGWRRRSWLKRLAQNAPMRASTRSPTLAPLTRTDPRQTIPSSFVFGRVDEKSVASSDAIGCVRKYVDSPSIWSPIVETTKTTYGRAIRYEVGSLSWRRLAWYSIVRRIGACSVTKTWRSVVPERT